MNTHFDSRIKGFDLGGLKVPEKNNEYTPGSNGGLSNAKKSVELLENQLGKNLSGKNLPGFSPINELNAADFTPTAVSGRILGFVETSIAQRAGSEVEAQSMLQQAREGIAQGFAEAREILSNMPAMTDKIAEQVDETESLIFKGLDQMQNSSASSVASQVISESGSLSSQFKQSSEASIQIVTRDGDKVDVGYSALLQFSASQSYAINQQGSAAFFESSSFASANFQFSVQGNLDKGEQKAINGLLKDVGKLANQFFNGDVQAAFNASLELGFDSRELKGFALDFQQSTYVEVAQTYQRTEQMGNSVASASPNSNPAPAIDVLSQLEQLLEQTKEVVKIEEAQQTVKNLLSGMLDLLNQNIKPEDSKVPLQSYIKDVIENA